MSIDNVNGFWVEEQAAELLGAKLVTDLAKQREDIDLEKDGVTYSVKWQKAALRSGNFSFELKQSTLDRVESIPGNFLLAKADKHVVAYPTGPKTIEFLVLDAVTLKALVYGNSWRWRRIWNKPETVEVNVRRGQKYVNHQNALVPVREVKKLAERTFFIELK
jgi:hypothetical protein